jgi:hypothetical protein
MPLSLQSISRVNGSGCNHFNVTFNIDGAISSAVISKAEFDTLMDSLNPLPGNYKHLLIALLARYRLEKGVNLAGLPAATVIS